MRNATILLVDDSPTIQRLVSKTLEVRLGTQNVITANNGKEALELLKSNDVDIIISDWNMPEMDGEEFLYEVKQNPVFKDLPFIMMTTNSERDFIVTAIQLGAANYLVKPFAPDELEEKLRLAWSGFNKRGKPRQSSLPKHVVQLEIDDKMLEGQIIDLSQIGTLISLKNDSVLSLFKTCTVSINLIDPQGVDQDTALISSLIGIVVRLEAQNSFHPTSRACQVGLYFNPTKNHKDVMMKLAKVVKWLSGRAPEIIDDNR